MKKTLPLITLASILAVSGCNVTTGDTSSGTSNISIAITDAPIDGATNVFINFTGLELKPASGQNLSYVFCGDQTVAVSEESCTNPSTRTIDLMALSGNLSTLLLNNAEVPAGQYNWIRLILADNDAGTLELDSGGQYPLTIPSGAETGLKLNRGFVTSTNGNADFTIDFDLRKSVHATGNSDYILRPTLRLVDNNQVGSLSGEVAANLIDSSCTPAIYLFEGSLTVPDDEGSANPPLTSAIVNMNNEGRYVYEIGFLEPGAYTAALTCQADLDDPSSDDNISFVLTKNASINAGENTELTIQNGSVGS